MVPMLKFVMLVVILRLGMAANAQEVDVPYNPQDGPVAVPGGVGPASACASGAPTSMIASVPPDLWTSTEVWCGRSMTVTCVKGIDPCSSTPTVTVQIVDEACTDCGERFILSQDAYYAIADPSAGSGMISVVYAFV